MKVVMVARKTFCCIPEKTQRKLWKLYPEWQRRTGFLKLCQPKSEGVSVKKPKLGSGSDEVKGRKLMQKVDTGKENTDEETDITFD